MKHLSKRQRVWAVLGAGLLVAAVSGSALARQIEDRDVSHLEIQKEGKLTTSTSPLPMPEPKKEEEFTGVVEVMASDMWVVDGRTAAVTAATEIKPGLTIGTLVKVHVVQLADGTLLADEITAVGSDDHGNSNSNDADHGNVNSNDDNGNDDHGGSGNVNSNDDNGNDDHGGSGNVNSNDHNGNDDHGGNGNVNSNDHNGNGEHGGSANVNSNDKHSDDEHGGNVNANEGHGTSNDD